MPYPILLIAEVFSPIDSMAMTRYLMYKNKINNMGNERLPKIALNSSQNQLRLKWCWCKDTMTWLNHWGINETTFCRTLTMSKILLLLSLKRNSRVRKI